MEIKVITQSEVSQDFLQKMANRMEVSFHKYGPVKEANGKIDEIKNLEQRLAMYKEDGNTEWLVDMANFCMIEFMHKGPEAFRATSAEESPGLIYTSGRTSCGRHTPVKDDFYKGRQE